jgi:hypothetical protein
VIHTVPPDWKDDSGGDPEAVLERCYQSVVEVSDRSNGHHYNVSFVPISCFSSSLTLDFLELIN